MTPVYSPSQVKFISIPGRQDVVSRHYDEVLASFNGRTGWYQDLSGRKEFSGMRLWKTVLRTIFGIKEFPPFERKTPTRHRKNPVVEVAPSTKSLTLEQELEKRAIDLGGTGPGIWVVYSQLEEVLQSFGLTVREALYHDIVRIVDRHPGQPRMGPDLDGYRVLKVDVLRDPSSLRKAWDLASRFQSEIVRQP